MVQAAIGLLFDFGIKAAPTPKVKLFAQTPLPPKP